MSYTREIPKLNLKFEVDLESLTCHCFLLKTGKRVWGYKFKNKESLIKTMDSQIKKTQDSKNSVIERRERKKQLTQETKNNIKVGDVYCYTFSYENTYRNFYEVTNIVKNKIFVKKLVTVTVEETSWASAKVKADKGNTFGEEILAKVNGVGLSIKRDIAYKVDNPETDVFYVSWGY
jgi:hypothetical protein